MPLNHTFCVAPMMQCTDTHNRRFLRKISKHAVLYTEMIAVNALVHGKQITKLDYSNEEHPIAVQLGGSDPKTLASAAILCDRYGYDEINLNLGCPSERVQKGSFGAALMLEPDLVKQCIESIQSVSSTPLTVKCRIGIDKEESYEFIARFVEDLASVGIDTFFIHARNAILSGLSPRQNRSIPPLKYDYVYKLKNDYPNLKIIINGGIKTISECMDHLKYVDGVMVGREAYDNPMFLKDVDEMLFGDSKSKLVREELLLWYLDYLDASQRHTSEYKIMLKHIYGLYKSEQNARKFRYLINESMQAVSSKPIRDFLQNRARDHQ